MDQLQGKAIIVTGSGRGIGAAIAAYCATLGAKIVVNDVDPQAADASVAQIKLAGGDAVACMADIRSWQAAGALVECCRDHFGSVDGLVNNAGIFQMGRIDEMQDGDAARLAEVNINGTANCTAHAIKHMQQRRRGAVVNITSGAQMGIPALGIYGATKAAVAAFTYAWALELKDMGIRVNAVSPMAKTDMAISTASYMRAHGLAPLPMPEISPEANAPLVAYLLSDASANVNGQIIRIEGGQLSIMTHPAVLLPILESNEWNYEAVEAAFRDDLCHRQVPVGIAGLQVNSYAAASKFWVKQDQAISAPATRG